MENCIKNIFDSDDFFEKVDIFQDICEKHQEKIAEN